MPSTPNDLLAHGDAALADLARAGSSEAFAELWSRHVGAGTVAARQFSAIADADDIVSESYLRIFRAMQHGGGPHEAFRPYLYRTIRNIALDWRAKQVSVSLEETAELEEPDSDPQLAVLDNVITARAFADLPERWQAVLWYLDVESMTPAEAAPLVGLSPNATSALAIRAREGFKKSWLQAHVSELTVPAACRWTTDRMAQYSRRALSPRARARFDRHLEDCARCSILVEEIDHLQGHLASILLPAALGAGAGGALLAQFAKSSNTVPTPRISASQKALVAGAGAVALVLMASAAVAITTQLTLAEPSASETEDQPVIPAPSSPPPSQTPSPTGSAPPQPPVQPPVSPPAAPRDRTAPAAPALTEPVDGSLTALARPTFSGGGEPGAQVDVYRLDVATGARIHVASGRVGADGRWTLTLAQPLPDATHTLSISQVDGAGNRSAETLRVVTVDTVAVAPVIDAPPTGVQLYLPQITGTAEAGSTITLRDETGVEVATGTADQAGAWSIAMPDPHRETVALSASQQDPAGNVSPWSADTAEIAFDLPQITAPADGALIASSGAGTVVQVELAGYEGLQVQVFIDGDGTGNVHTLEATPIARVTPPLADGPHSLGVRYFDPVTGRPGPTFTIHIVIG